SLIGAAIYITGGKILIQTFAIPFNTSQVIRNKGFTSVIQFKDPITVKSITETCTVSHIPEPSSRPCGCAIIEVTPHILGWYPNNSSVAPIAIATFVGPTIREFSAYLHATILNAESHEYYVGFYISQPTTSPGRLKIPGPSITLDDANFVVKAYNGSCVNPSLSKPVNSIQIYMLGQVAWINWTVCMISPYCYFNPSGSRLLCYYYQVMITRIVVCKSDCAVAPKLYVNTTYINSCENNRCNGGGGGWGGHPPVTESNLASLSKYLPAPVNFTDLIKKACLSYCQHCCVCSISLFHTYTGMGIGINVGALVAVASAFYPDLAPLIPYFSTINIAVGWKCSTVQISSVTLSLRNLYSGSRLLLYYSNQTDEYCICGNYYQLPPNVYVANYT
ncbi:hypothetical protein DDW13_00050, partial [Acidianus hospitalis]